MERRAILRRSVAGLTALGVAGCTGTGGDAVGEVQRSSPSAQFDFQYDEASSTLTVVFTAGESITRENTGVPPECSSPSLAVTFGDTTRCWGGGDGGSLPLSAGDEITGLDVSSGDTVEVVWFAPDGSESSVLADYEVPRSGRGS